MVQDWIEVIGPGHAGLTCQECGKDWYSEKAYNGFCNGETWSELLFFFFFLSHFSSSVEKKMDKEEAGDKKVIAVLGERW